jgi:O-antigen ligase
LGLVVIVGGYGEEAVGTARLTYYEPAGNWLMMIAVLGIVATLVARLKPAPWGSPAPWVSLLGLLLITSLVLSYRRSFWIALAAGLLLVVLLGLSPGGRRLLLPVGLLAAVAIWVLGSVGFQAQTPVAERARSLAPSKLITSAEDRYRLDERANVLGEIRRRPVSGLGIAIPWRASVRPLGVEHEYGRDYVHFAALWYWAKLGLLGLAAYLSIIAAGLLLAWRTWRRCRGSTARAFGLASLCGIVGLLVMETTASFTGVDARFTVLFAAQLGLLAVLVRPQPSQWRRSPA